MKRTKSMYYKQTQESRELLHFTENLQEIYRRFLLPAYEKFDKLRNKGIYDHEKAIDLIYYASTYASNIYYRDFEYRFSVTDRFTVAVDLVLEYEDEVGMQDEEGGK